MAKVDDLLQRRAKQIVLAVVARLAHGSSLTANLAVKGIMNPASRESQNARNPTSTPGFLAKSITCSGQITTINQSLPNSSRATTLGVYFFSGTQVVLALSYLKPGAFLSSSF